MGANVRAARYAGINVGRNMVLAMALSGALAGMAGANEVLGVNYNLAGVLLAGLWLRLHRPGPPGQQPSGRRRAGVPALRHAA